MDKFAVTLPTGLPSKRTRYSTVCGVINTLILFLVFLAFAAYAGREIYLIFSEEEEVVDLTLITDETTAPSGPSVVEVIPETVPETETDPVETPEKPENEDDDQVTDEPEDGEVAE